MSADRPIPIILDTDIGDNVDDALALAFACQAPELKLLGVTTVYRDPSRRAAIARELLASLGRDDVPIAVGVGKPLLQTWDRRPPKYVRADWARRYEKLDGRRAPQFLLDLAFVARTEPITVCCIGPLTNLAVALATEPKLAERIRVVLMGGMIAGERLETNVAADPEAASIVLASGADVTMVGLDVTLECVLGAGQVERIKSAGLAHTPLLARMLDAWMSDSGRLPVLHDPLAVAMCFDRSLCERQRLSVTVETDAGPPRGRTVARPSGDSRINVCTAVARDRFIELFLARICAPTLAREESR